MLIGGVDSVWISVSNLDKALSFYRDYIGFPAMAEEPLTPELAALFKPPVGSKARSATVRGGLRRTAVKLVEFAPVSTRIFHEGATAWDYGQYCLTYLVKDIYQVDRDLKERGFRSKAPPYRYKLDFIPYDVAELTVETPGGVYINHFQRFTEDKYGVAGNYVRLDHTALMVESLAEARRFGEAVGLECLGETAWPDGVIDSINGLPKGTHTKEAYWGLKDGTSTILDFYEYSMKGRPAAGRLPGIGILGFELVVDDFEDTLKRLSAAQFPLFAGPTFISEGKKAAMVEGPGAALALIRAAR